ncbi:MAG: L-serine ammonia-lyase, iron-sulfur-dependent subunit beta [Eubacteriales bacterium]|nr:L-serine ammonia-lyase, iron-sulfur-dependent subunit beta [Eubacteriales bacterium]
MNLMDIIGPVMVGPSSSHTAGAVRIGYIARKLLGEPVKSVDILLYGSFLATGNGHGTKQALVAGLLGMHPDDERIPASIQIARDQHVDIHFGEANLRDAHPNSVKLVMEGMHGKKLSVVGASIGGGRIRITQIDGLTVNVTGEYPALIVHNLDQPGHIAEVSSMLSHKAINVATMQLYRSGRGGHAVMIFECDQEVPKSAIEWLSHLEGVEKVTYLSLED